MRLLTVFMALGLCASGFADTITMKDGRIVQGTYLGGSPRQVKLEVGDQIQTLDIADIARIEFGGAAQSAAEPAPPPPPPVEARDRDRDRPVLVRPESQDRDRPVLVRPDTQAPDNAAVSPASGVELPAGTNLVVRMIDGVDSEIARPGQTFAASLDQAVLDRDGQTVLIPRGADVVVKLVDEKQSGTFTGRAGVTLNLQSVKVNGRMVDVNSQSISRVGDSRGNETAKRGAIGAVAGAALGGIFGGGKGAAEGAAVGGGVGAGSQVVTKGSHVKIPSETRLTFVLDTPVRL